MRYDRILTLASKEGDWADLLERAGCFAQGDTSQLLVLHVLDTRSGFASEGPAGRLPEDIAGRRLPGVKVRLELQLARYGLSWAETSLAWGSPHDVLARTMQAWKPDLVIGCRGSLPEAFPNGADRLTVARSPLHKRGSIPPHPQVFPG